MRAFGPNDELRECPASYSRTRKNLLIAERRAKIARGTGLSVIRQARYSASRAAASITGHAWQPGRIMRSIVYATINERRPRFLGEGFACFSSAAFLDAFGVGAVLSRSLRGSSGGNRLDQRRIVVLHTADPFADLPADHPLRRIRDEQRFQLRGVGRLFAKPCRPGLRREDHGHPVMELGTELVRLSRDDREAAHPFVGRRLPVLPHAGQRDGTEVPPSPQLIASPVAFAIEYCWPRVLRKSDVRSGFGRPAAARCALRLAHRNFALPQAPFIPRPGRNQRSAAVLRLLESANASRGSARRRAAGGPTRRRLFGSGTTAPARGGNPHRRRQG
jgi:hypothetical protein